MMFPKIGVDYYREISSCFYSLTSWFFYFFPIFCSHFYILSNLVYQSTSGVSFWSFSSILVCSVFLDSNQLLLNEINYILNLTYKFYYFH